jgi:hypothetical protein
MSYGGLYGGGWFELWFGEWIFVVIVVGSSGIGRGYFTHHFGMIPTFTIRGGGGSKSHIGTILLFLFACCYIYILYIYIYLYRSERRISRELISDSVTLHLYYIIDVRPIGSTAIVVAPVVVSWLLFRWSLLFLELLPLRDVFLWFDVVEDVVVVMGGGSMIYI